MDALTQPPGGLMLASLNDVTGAAVEAADHAMRHWAAEDLRGPIPLGGEAHLRITNRMFRETFNPYKPSLIDWPKLSEEARDRLVSLPIWDIATQTEGRARLRMLTYAVRQAGEGWRDAIELNGWEEGRHKVILSDLVRAYGIQLAPEPAYLEPDDPEWAYLVTGFSECVDSFFAFGLFALARRSEFFPPELVETFEPVIQEEARHILLFANWLAWHRRNLPAWRRPWFELRIAAVWVFLAWERMAIARGLSGDRPDDNNFTVTGGKAVSGDEVGIRELLVLCLAENDRRFAGYDPRLVRPVTMPLLTRWALALMGLWHRKA